LQLDGCGGQGRAAETGKDGGVSDKSIRKTPKKVGRCANSDVEENKKLLEDKEQDVPTSSL